MESVGGGNIKFFCSDARSIEYKKNYDAAMILGMLMYMENPEDIYTILKNLSENLKQDAYLVTKDTLNAENKDVVYMFNQKNGYKACYWSQNVYYEQFKKAGFQLEKEILLEDCIQKNKNMHFVARGGIWKKIR